MLFLLIILSQLGCLFLLSRAFQRLLSGLLLHITGSSRLAMWVLALLFLPGTLLHEVAHVVMARLLLVPAGHLTVFPRMVEDRVVMGSVLIGATDRVRRLIIGVAPGIVGVTLLLVLLEASRHLGLWNSVFWRAVLGYMVFQVSNTLFSSRADLEGAMGLLIILVMVAALCVGMGWRPSLEWVVLLLDHHALLLSRAMGLLWVPLALDAVGIALLWPAGRLLQAT